MLAIGIMSGTSLDGVDCALVELFGSGFDTKFTEKDFETYDIPCEIKGRIKNCCDIEKSNVADICSLNFELGKLFGECAVKLCEKNNIKSSELDFIACHGQTIFHIPTDTKNHSRSTLQIGEPTVIAEITGCKVVSNFRERDMAVGGTGAPLVPYTDKIMFGDQNIAVNNIGGISNVTVLSGDDTFAFDTGPGNMIIDEVCSHFFGKSFDKNGDFASQGTVNNEMLDELLSHKYLKQTPPKATGREEFGEFFVSDLIKKYSQVDGFDFVATVTVFTAKTIAMAYNDFIKTKLDKMIICGGGAYNKYLMNAISNELSNVVTLEDVGMNSSSKEAVAFAILGNECLHNISANVPKVTGATKNVVLGRVTNG